MSASQAPRRSSRSVRSEGIVEKGVVAGPEVVYKMSKKIAQLTKVIYYLNTKNEDHNVEIQSLIEAYEDELVEVIKDGTTQIGTLHEQLTDTQGDLKTKDLTIESYVRTIETQLQELRECYMREEVLKEQIEAAGLTTETIQTNLTEMRKLSDSQHLETKSFYVEKMKEEAKLHEEQIKMVKKSQEKEIQALIEDVKNSQSLLKDTVNSMNRQMDEERKNFNLEKNRMEKEHSEEVKELEDMYKTQVKELTDEVEHVKKRYKDITETLEAVQSKLKAQNLELEEATAKLEEQNIQMLELKTKAKMYQETYNDMKLELDIVQESYTAATQRLNTQQIDITEKVAALTEMEASKKILKEKFEQTTSELTILQANFESAQYTINDLNVNLYESNKQRAELEIAKVEAERKLTERDDEITRMSIEMNERRIRELQQQYDVMTESFDKQLNETIDQLNRDKETVIGQKNAEMAATLDKHAKVIEGWEERLAKEQAVAFETKNFMQDQLDKMEEAKNLVKEKLEQGLKVIQEKVNEIQAHLATIQNLNNQIKSLEADKADLYQKMVKIDDQIRGEMNEHFRLEKMEITDAWTIKHATEMQNLRDSMTAHHHYELMTAIEKTETDYKEQINVLTNEHNIRTEEWERLRVELQDKIMGLEINIKMLTKGLVDLKEDNNRRIAQIMEEHAKFLEQEHKNFEYELQAKETQLKVASTIALGNLEKKHASIMEELDADHKRNMDDLKNTNTKNALAAKKDAENKLNVEVARLKGIHAEEMETLSNLSAEEMAKAMLSMNMTRMAELKDQAEAHQQTVDTFNSRIAELNEEILRRVGVEANFARQVDSLDAEIEDLNEQIANRVLEISHLKERHEKALETQYNDLIRGHEGKIRDLNEDHIQEAQKMIEEFQQVQEFLKKQIAQQTQQLRDAEIKYINREPREVDVTRIAELEEDIRRRKRKAHALMEELEYCKLELSNREANFNKIFNKNPLVGVMQPIGTLKAQEKKSPPKKSNSMSKLPPLPLYSPTMTPLPNALQTASFGRMAPHAAQSESN